MPPHHPRSADVLPFPVDHAAPRFVRPMRELDMARAVRDQQNVDLYMTLEEQQHLEAAAERWRRQQRVEQWQIRIGWACITLASLTILYFIFQAGRGL